MMYAVIRLRGSVGVRKSIKDTLKMLRLNKINHCVIVPETKSFKGMLDFVKDYVTYGEINKETLTKLLEKRGRLPGGRPLSKENLKEITGFDSFEDFADAILKGKVKLKDYKIKPVFRLNSPRKGLKSKKKHYPKGDLGYRGKDINELIERML